MPKQGGDEEDEPALDLHKRFYAVRPDTRTRRGPMPYAAAAAGRCSNALERVLAVLVLLRPARHQRRRAEGPRRTTTALVSARARSAPPSRSRRAPHCLLLAPPAQGGEGEFLQEVKFVIDAFAQPQLKIQDIQARNRGPAAPQPAAGRRGQAGAAGRSSEGAGRLCFSRRWLVAACGSSEPAAAADG